MHSNPLNVSRVLMAADPASPQWKTALGLAEALAGHGVSTVLACTKNPTAIAFAKAKKIEGLDIRMRGDSGSLEWMLFLEMLVRPDLVQLFDPEHVLMP